MKKGIIFIAIGIILLAIDIRIPMWEEYPKMEIVDDLGEILQGYIINNLIGKRPMIDLISDVLGYVFLFLGSIFLVKYDKRFILAMAFIPFTIYLYVHTMQLPYNFVLRDLYLKAAGYHFLMVIIEILVELLIIRGVINMIQCTQIEWNINELLFGWALAMISKGVLSGIQFFFSRGVLYYIYSLIMIGATVFYLNRLYVITKFKLEGAIHEEK